MSNPRPILALLYGATFWGLVWYPVRWLEQNGLEGLWLTLVAYTAAILVFVPFAGPVLPALRRRPTDLALLALGSGWTNIAFVLALLEGEVARVLLLFYLNPLWATVLGWALLGERVQPATWVALPLGIAGGLLMLWQPGPDGMAVWGEADGLALTAGMAFALTNTMTRKCDDVTVPVKTGVAWMGVVVLSAVGLSATAAAVPAVPLPVWGGAIALGLAGFLITTLLVVYGVSHLPLQRSALILLFEILVGALSAWWLAGEILSLREWVGGALIIAAGVIAIIAAD